MKKNYNISTQEFEYAKTYRAYLYELIEHMLSVIESLDYKIEQYKNNN